MMVRHLVILALPAGLAACVMGFPWEREPDPGAGATLADAAPLIDQCQAGFKTALGATPVEFDSGPTVERDGDFRRVTLWARSTDPDAIHPYRYECRFESGKLVSAELQH